MLYIFLYNLKYYYDLIEKDLLEIDNTIDEDYKEIYKALVLLGFDFRDYSKEYIAHLFKEDIEVFIKGMDDGIPSSALIYRMRKHMWDKSEAYIHLTDPNRHGRDATTNTSGIPLQLNGDSEDSTGTYLGTANGATLKYDRQWMLAHWSLSLAQGKGTYTGSGGLSGFFVGLPGNKYTTIYESHNTFNVNAINPQTTAAVGRKDFHIPNAYMFTGSNTNISLSTLIRDSNRYYYTEGLYRNTETLHSSHHIAKTNALLKQRVSYPILDSDTYKKINHSCPILKITGGGHSRYLGTERSVNEFGYPREVVNSNNTQTTTTEPYNSIVTDVAANKNHTMIDVDPIKSSGPIPKISIRNAHGTYYQSRDVNVFNASVNVQVSSNINTADIASWPGNVGEALPVPGAYSVNAVVELLDINIQPSSNGHIITGIADLNIASTLHGSSGIVQNIVTKKIHGFWGGYAHHDHWEAYARFWFPQGALVGIAGTYDHTSNGNGYIASTWQPAHTATLAHETEAVMHIGGTGHSTHHHHGHGHHRHGAGNYYAATLYGHTSVRCDAG